MTFPEHFTKEYQEKFPEYTRRFRQAAYLEKKVGDKLGLKVSIHDILFSRNYTRWIFNFSGQWVELFTNFILSYSKVKMSCVYYDKEFRTTYCIFELK